MRRAAIYARFSTDLQNERSIEDQITLCQEFAKREGLEIVSCYEDRARSGSSILGRDGLLSLMDAARSKGFDVIIVEALDRLSRDMEDLAGIHKRLSFQGIEIRAVHEGVVNTVLVGLRGLVGQLYREDNAHKVRRGAAGRIKSGLIAGGLTYGYSTIVGELGRRVVNEEEAAVVQRIFREYLTGRTPRDIAKGLNRDGVRAPRGRAWNASTINGNAQRRNGIIQNEIYRGLLIWNKVRMIKDPDTGRRVSRPNPESEWKTAEHPELAIIDQPTFAAAASIKAGKSRSYPGNHKRPRHMLSGLLKCAACGAGMTTFGKDKSGRIRVRCSAQRESGSCPEPQSMYLATIEESVVDLLRGELAHPKLISLFVKAYHEERRSLDAASNTRRAFLKKRLADVSNEAERAVDLMIKGIGDPLILGAKTRELATEKVKIEEELAAIPAAENTIELHPATLRRYGEKLAALQESMANGTRDGDLSSASIMRELIESVTVRRDPDRRGGVDIVVAGKLSALLGLASFPTRVGGLVVAADRYRQTAYSNLPLYSLSSSARLSG